MKSYAEQKSWGVAPVWEAVQSFGIGMCAAQDVNPLANVPGIPHASVVQTWYNYMAGRCIRSEDYKSQMGPWLAFMSHLVTDGLFVGPLALMAMPFNLAYGLLHFFMKTVVQGRRGKSTDRDLGLRPVSCLPGMP